jgi:hypothetical protein
MLHGERARLTPAAGAEQDPETWFHTLATHFVEAQIYFHLNQLGVMHQLRDGGARSAEIAARMQLDERILDILLDYVANVGQLVACRPDGRYALTPFGRRVLDRYSKTNGERQTFNLFDVRIGAWGPLWTNLGGLLDGSIVYGRDLHRIGDYAADGLFKLAAPLGSAIEHAAARLGAATVVEIGPTSGILAQLAERAPARTYVGVDVKQRSLSDAEALAAERGVRRIRWLQGDLFEPEPWLAQLPAGQPTLFFSCHFHEFLAGGKERVAGALERLTHWPAAAGVVVLEQPRLELAQRDDVSLTQWLYAHSNVLIHHLIKNAKILTNQEWRHMLLDAGCASVSLEQTDCFGFTSLVGAIAGSPEPRPAN